MAEASGRGNDVVPDLRNRMVSTIEGLIDRAEVILVGNSYAEAQDPLSRVMNDQPMVDLTRLQSGIVSRGTYQGICW